MALLIEHVAYIYDSVRFKKNRAKVQALPDSDNEVQTMLLAYVAKLGLKVQLTNVRA